MGVRPEDLKATLRARARTEQQRQTERAAEVEQRLRTALIALPEDLKPARAWLVGSLAYGTFGAESDVDVVVEGVALEDVSALWAELSRTLPVAVDVLRLEELDEAFQRRVHDEGRELHVA